LRSTLWIAPFYLVATLIFTWPLARDFGHALPAMAGDVDPLLQVFLVGWDLQSFASAPQRIYAAPIFHPEPRALTFMDSMIGEAALAAPIYAATRNLPAAYNTVVVLSFVLSGWVAYRLVRLFGVSRAGAWLAGFLFAFGSYRISNLSNLNQLQTELLALALYFLERARRRPETRWAWALAATFVAQCTLGWYYAMFLLVMIALFAVGVWWVEGFRRPRRVPPSVVAAVVSALLVGGWMALPYVQQRRAMPEFQRTLIQTILYSADLLDYGRTNQGNRLARLMHWPTQGLGLWPGLVTVALAILAVVGRWTSSRGSAGAPRSGSFVARTAARFRAAGRRLHDAGRYLLLAVGSMVLSLGPLLKVNGRWIKIAMPYAVLFFLPGFQSLRAPSRLGALTLLACAVLAGLGYAALERWWRARGWAPSWLFVTLLMVAAVDLWSSPIPMVEFPDRASMPPVYAWLARQPGVDAALVLPAPAAEYEERVTHARRQVYGLYHRKPMLDGVSGFVPPGTRALRQAVQEFPAPVALRAIAERGGRYVIVRYGELEPERRVAWRRAVAHAPRLRERARFGDDVVYELGPR
jgi:hypothetical protein